MPSTGLNAAVTIMNKASSPPAVKLQNLVEGSKKHELSATPAVWTVNLGNGRRCLPSPLPQASLLHHCPSLWDIGCLGCSAPSSDCPSKRREWVASHRVWGLSDSPQHGKNPRVASWRCQVSSDSCFPPVVIPPAPSPPAALTTLTKRGRTGLFLLLLKYLDTEIIINGWGFHVYLLKFQLPMMPLKYAHL